MYRGFNLMLDEIDFGLMDEKKQQNMKIEERKDQSIYMVMQLTF